MRVVVDQDLCISCGACVDACPEVFDFNDEEKAQVIVNEVPTDVEEIVQEAIENCPTNAIREV